MLCQMLHAFNSARLGHSRFHWEGKEDTRGGGKRPQGF